MKNSRVFFLIAFVFLGYSAPINCLFAGKPKFNFSQPTLQKRTISFKGGWHRLREYFDFSSEKKAHDAFQNTFLNEAYWRDLVEKGGNIEYPKEYIRFC